MITLPAAQIHGLTSRGYKISTADMNEASAAKTLTCPTRRINSGTNLLAPKKPTK